MNAGLTVSVCTIYNDLREPVQTETVRRGIICVTWDDWTKMIIGLMVSLCIIYDDLCKPVQTETVRRGIFRVTGIIGRA